MGRLEGSPLTFILLCALGGYILAHLIDVLLEKHRHHLKEQYDDMVRTAVTEWRSRWPEDLLVDMKRYLFIWPDGSRMEDIDVHMSELGYPRPTFPRNPYGDRY